MEEKTLSQEELLKEVELWQEKDKSVASLLAILCTCRYSDAITNEFNPNLMEIIFLEKGSELQDVIISAMEKTQDEVDRLENKSRQSL